MRETLLVVAVVSSLVGVAGLTAAQQPSATPSSVARLTTAPRPGAPFPRASSVMGFAWSPTSDPLPGAPVQLRNVLTGRVEATAHTSSAGEFLFDHVEGGTYVVELVNENGRVLALGAPFTVGQGETVATFVRLGAPASWFSGAFTNAAEAAISSAASLGVTAVAPPATAASADR
jgi:hypothetical protein